MPEITPKSTARPVSLRGMALLNHPVLNKGTAFTAAEREAFGLDGLLPLAVETLEQQCVRAYEAYKLKPNDLERYIYLRQLQDRNEVLFYRLVLDHIDEMMPVVYTPVVGLGCQQYSRIFRRPRGLFISYPQRHMIPALLRNYPHREIDIIVVTDGERILGTGDQGVGGLGIPIGKLSLYTLIGGINPERTLPIVLDVGTNNEERLRDPAYLGWRHRRVTGSDYDEFIDDFVKAVKEVLPGTLLQWEDFSKLQARAILDRYQNELLTFNDDIQGTAAITLAAIVAAAHVAHSPLRDQEVVILGAGSASTGVADYMAQAMMSDGLSEEEARRRFWIVNTGGLLHTDRTDLSPIQRAFSQPSSRVADWTRGSDGKIGLAEVINHIRATVLIGLSTTPGSFTEPLVREMARKVERPIIFPLSNPTDKAEALPSDLIAWTNGRALVATGSPFAPVEYNGRTYPIAQCNNAYIFPAIGLAAVASITPDSPGIQRVTDGTIIASARALADLAPALKDPSEGALLPPLKEIRDVSVEVAYGVVREAESSGMIPKTDPEVLRSRVVKSQWAPAYVPYVPAK
jgi:malate dehydrogenase (oxaloacetate-decarboxylating)